MEMLLIAHFGAGWVVVRMRPNETPEIVSGPYTDHADAVKAVEIHVDLHCCARRRAGFY